MNITFSIYIIYRPPKPDYTTFFNEFNDLILNIPISTKHQTTILGDFNYNFHSTLYPHSSFKYLTDSLDMNQVVHFPTHTAGNSLDLIFCRSHDSCNCLINCTKSDLLTDHFIITCTVILPLLPSLSKKLIHYRKIKSINIPLCSSELVSIRISLPISPESINSTLFLINMPPSYLLLFPCILIAHSLHLILLNSSDLYVKLKEHIVVFLLLKTFYRLLIIANSTNHKSVKQNLLTILIKSIAFPPILVPHLP